MTSPATAKSSPLILFSGLLLLNFPSPIFCEFFAAFLPAVRVAVNKRLTLGYKLLHVFIVVFHRNLLQQKIANVLAKDQVSFAKFSIANHGHLTDRPRQIWHTIHDRFTDKVPRFISSMIRTVKGRMPVVCLTARN